MDKFQDITIKHVDNGLKVKVGCINLVYQQKDLKQFFKDLEDYFVDSQKTEKAIRKRWNLKEPESGICASGTSVGDAIYLDTNASRKQE